MYYGEYSVDGSMGEGGESAFSTSTSFKTGAKHNEVLRVARRWKGLGPLFLLRVSERRSGQSPGQEGRKREGAAWASRLTSKRARGGGRGQAAQKVWSGRGI
jgi:hypothetical protein